MNRIRKRVSDITRRYGTNEPFLLCEYLGIITQVVPLPQKTYGLYLKAYGLPFVFVSRMLHDEEQRFVCAHELGHAVLHPDMNSLYLTENTLFSKGKLETEADAFAAELLIQDSDLSDCFYEGETIEELSRRLSVPKRYIELKKQSLAH